MGNERNIAIKGCFWHKMWKMYIGLSKRVPLSTCQQLKPKAISELFNELSVEVSKSTNSACEHTCLELPVKRKK